jgi:Sulfotransferase domain
MIVLCNGMPRSASTWSFNVCRLLFHDLHPKSTLCARYHENLAEVIDPLRGSYDHVVLKCHTLDQRGRELCRTGVARAIYTHRDPFDAIHSAMVMFRHSFEEALESIRGSLALYDFHLSTGEAHIVSYDAIVGTPERAIADLAAYLELSDLNAFPEAVRRISAQTSMDAMKEIARQVGRERHGIRTPRSIYDPETHVHRDHIRDGRTGCGRDYLSADQLRRAETALAPYLHQAHEPA